ncbi:MAG TPA: TauD/TfdA family dioxygenase [Myxococcota bacterium]|nr:TauD/TfdA family dioxygenase [Myxococcota bacterium]
MDVRIETLGDLGVPRAVVPLRPLRLEQWIGGQRAWLRDALLEHGALLFRGFDVRDPQRLAAFLSAASLPLMDYPRGTSPRTEVGPRIYTSTETRPDVAIPLHSEMSYTNLYPEGVAFCCVEVSGEGGATPLADLRGVLARIPREFLDEVGRRGLRYRQIVPLVATATLERTWPAMFGSSERAEVERLAAAQGIRCDWLADGSLSITGQCPALRPHPRSGERVWFNQAHVFHLKLFRYLENEGVKDAREQAREYAQRHAAAPLEPYACWFGDGGEISEADMAAVRKALDAETRRFDWQPGDLLLLDNFRVAHGREAFRGSRRVLAALVSRLWEN